MPEIMTHALVTPDKKKLPTAPEVPVDTSYTNHWYLT
jgi:hypothetical protein